MEPTITHSRNYYTSLPFPPIPQEGLSDRRRGDIAGFSRQNFNQITMLVTYVRTRAEKESRRPPQVKAGRSSSHPPHAAHKSRSSAPAVDSPPLLGATGFTNEPKAPAAADVAEEAGACGRIRFCAPQIPA